MADPEKFRAIKNAEALTTAEEDSSLLGTTKYVSRFSIIIYSLKT